MNNQPTGLREFAEYIVGLEQNTQEEKERAKYAHNMMRQYDFFLDELAKHIGKKPSEDIVKVIKWLNGDGVGCRMMWNAPYNDPDIPAWWEKIVQKKAAIMS